MPEYSATSIVTEVQNFLRMEGFEKPRAYMQIKLFDKEWREWISVISYGSKIDIRIGVFTTTVNDIIYDVRKLIGPGPYEKIRKYRIGPPNVLLPLSLLVDPDPRAQTKMPWYDTTDKDPAFIFAQIVEAIREYANPFFERNRSYQALLESALRYGTLNRAQQYSTPVLMALLGRRDQLREFVELCASHGITDQYRRFIGQLEPYLDSRGLLPHRNAD